MLAPILAATVAVATHYTAYALGAVRASMLGGAVSCGTERWAVKTLADPEAAYLEAGAEDMMSVRALAGLPPIHTHATATRAEGGAYYERQIYSVRATVVCARVEEDDSDIHLCLAEPGHVVKSNGKLQAETSAWGMIAESPDPRCVADSPRSADLAGARRQVERAAGGNGLNHKLSAAQLRTLVGHTYCIQGVGFVDVSHGQLGRSQSNLELHPIIGFAPCEQSR
jgi:hypothetical protein